MAGVLDIPTYENLTPYQQTMLDVWMEHGRCEFGLRDPDATIKTMCDNPYIMMIGLGRVVKGREEVYNFYKYDFLPNIPDDSSMELVQRFFTNDHIIDEFVVRFTHNIEMPWKAPGVKPTGRKVELTMMVIAGFEGDKLAYEHLMWDHCSLLSQLGVITDPVATIGMPSASMVLKLAKGH